MADGWMAKQGRWEKNLGYRIRVNDAARTVTLDCPAVLAQVVSTYFKGDTLCQPKHVTTEKIMHLEAGVSPDKDSPELAGWIPGNAK